MFLADSCGFFAGPLDSQVVDSNIVLNLLHLTAARPSKDRRTMKAIVEDVSSTLKVLEAQSSVQIIRCRRDLDNLGDKIGVVLGIQAPPEDYGLTYRDVTDLHALGICISTIAYDRSNWYGGGFAAPSEPLTPAGMKYMDWCTEANIITDLAHAGHRTADEAIKFAYAYGLPPLIASHTACYARYHHLRNLPDAVLDQVAQQNGIVGILSLTSFLHDEGNGTSMDAFYTHLRHAIEVCGENHVCIGSDGCYQQRDLKAWKDMHSRLLSMLDPQNDIFRVRWPDQPIVLNRPDRMQLLADDMLAREGFSPGVVEKIVGGNFLRFLQASLPET